MKILISVVLMFVGLQSFADSGVEDLVFETHLESEHGDLRKRPRRPRPPAEKTETPYTLFGIEKDCSLTVLNYTAGKRSSRRPFPGSIEVIFSSLPRTIVELKRFGRDYVAKDKMTGFNFRVSGGSVVGSKTPLSRGTYRIFSDKRELLDKCSFLSLRKR